MFIPPMWDSESERIGKQRCTPAGYAIHQVAGVLGCFGFLLLFGLLVLLAFRALSGQFSGTLLILLTVPLAMGIAARFLWRYSWHLAERKGFQYNGERGEATWLEDGRQVSYRWRAEKD